jgi:hypothetical protein
MSRVEYVVLKEKMKENECGWSNIGLHFRRHAEVSIPSR